MEHIFRPDEARYRKVYADEFEFIRKVLTQFGGGKRSPNLTLIEEFHGAWCEVRADDAAGRLRGNAELFGWKFSDAMRIAQSWFSRVIAEHLADRESMLDSIDESASGGVDELIELGRLYPRAPDPERVSVKSVCAIADAWADDESMLPLEALRKLTVASQIVALEAVDSFRDLTRDMTLLNRLCNERLWQGSKNFVTINYAITTLSRGTEQLVRLHPHVPITFGANRPSVPTDATAHSKRVKCRMVEDGDRTYLVMTTARPKELFATILKEEEARPALDRRGLKHVIVAVGKGGHWRAATHEDAENFADLCRSRLWHGELFEVPDESRVNHDSSPFYRNVKIMGRIHRPSYRRNGMMVEPSVEHMIVPIDMDLDTEHAPDLNHAEYRRKRVHRVFVPAWFGAHLQNAALSPTGK